MFNSLGYHWTHLPLDKMATIMADDIFKCIFLNENDELQFKIHWNLFQESNWQYSSIGSGNGLVPNRRQAITWTNDDHWRIIAALEGDELNSMHTKYLD